MYIFYADESGFSKGGNFEPSQPITVFAGILIERTKLFKALDVFDGILTGINKTLTKKVKELKFNDIKQGAYPYKISLPKVDDKCDFLEHIISIFIEEISIKFFYCAIDDEKFFAQKRDKFTHTNRLAYPYSAGCYRVISQIEQHHQNKKNNRGKTFLILDEQNILQHSIEDLIAHPIHKSAFSQIIDTAYFGKSHYSRLIQIADLIAGIIRYHLWVIHFNRPKTHFIERISRIFQMIDDNSIFKECFTGDLKTLYEVIEI